MTSAPYIYRFLEENQLSRLQYVRDALYDPKILSPDKRRDLAHILDIVLNNVEDQILPDKYMEEEDRA